jgi:hypothetical protein
MTKMDSPRIYYRDFITHKRKYTRGSFIEWTRGGPLNAWYAVVALPSETLLIPEYCLEQGQNIPPKPHDDAAVTKPILKGGQKVRIGAPTSM